MPVGSVVLTPRSPALTLDVPTLDLSAHDIPAQEWVARVAVAMRASTDALPAPLLLVLAGPNAAHAPALGFAQRAARKLVAHYVLIDPHLPAAGSVDWPDAPVTVIVSPGADDEARSQALAARLRGWQVVDADPVAVIGDLVRAP